MTEIAVVRALQLGDMLCAIPALRSLRSRYPDARITLIGLPWADTLVERFSDYLDDFVAFPGFPGLPELPVAPGAVVAFLSSMQRHGWDLAVQLHGAGTSINECMALLGARALAGFTPPGVAPPTTGSGDLWLPYPSHGPESDRLLALTAALGGSTDRWLEFPVTPADVDELDRALDPRGRRIDRPFAVVHPGGSTPSRRWPAARFAAVADAVADEGVEIVLTGTSGEAALTAEVARTMAAPAIDLAGATTLGSVGALTERARIVITNDTGISHVAAALETDSVTISVASDRERWAPVGRGRHVYLGGWDPDELRHGPPPPVEVQVRDVVAAARGLLAAA